MDCPELSVIETQEIPFTPVSWRLTPVAFVATTVGSEFFFVATVDDLCEIE
jgi:hypothetical protein